MTSSSSNCDYSLSIKNESRTTAEFDKPLSKITKKRSTNTCWKPKDDLLLRYLKEEQRLGWKEISSFFKTRTPHACQFRWRRLVLENSASYGNSNKLKDHTRLSPVNINKNADGWTLEEDNLLLSLHEKNIDIHRISLILSSKSEREIPVRIQYLTSEESNPPMCIKLPMQPSKICRSSVSHDINTQTIPESPKFNQTLRRAQSNPEENSRKCPLSPLLLPTPTQFEGFISPGQSRTNSIDSSYSHNGHENIFDRTTSSTSSNNSSRSSSIFGGLYMNSGRNSIAVPNFINLTCHEKYRVILPPISTIFQSL